MYSIDDLFEQNKELTVLPEIVTELNRLLDDPKSTIDAFANLIELDPALTAKLLAIANSPLYKFAYPVESINIAVSVIGLKQLRDLVLTTCVVNKFNQIPNEVFDLYEFWRHSVSVGFLAKEISMRVKQVDPDQMFVCGILHDIGKLVMAVNAPEKVLQVRKQVATSIAPREQIELAVFGFGHAKVSAELVKRWNLPDSFYTPIAGHHRHVLEDDYRHQSAILYLSDQLAHEYEGHIHKMDNLNYTIFDYLGLEQTIALKLGEYLENNLDSILNIFSVKKAA